MPLVCDEASRTKSVRFPRGRRSSGSRGRRSTRRPARSTPPSISPRARLQEAADAVRDKIEGVLDGLGDERQARPKGSRQEGRPDLPTQGHAQGHQAPGLATDRGARLPARGPPRGYPDRHGLADSHLHQFVVNGEYYGPPADDLGFGTDMEVGDEEGILLSQVVKGDEGRFRYEYDFGDGWRHEVLFEKTVEAEPARQVPPVRRGEAGLPARGLRRTWGLRRLPCSHRRPEARGPPGHEGVGRRQV